MKTTGHGLDLFTDGRFASKEPTTQNLDELQDKYLKTWKVCKKIVKIKRIQKIYFNYNHRILI